MPRLILHILKLLLLVLIIRFSANAGETGWRYSGIIEDVASLPMDLLIDKAVEAEKRDPGDAMVMYMVACNRDISRLSDSDRELCSYAHFRMGYILYEKGNYAKSLDYLVKAQKICDGTERRKYAAPIYKDIGIIYSVYKDYEKGLDYMRKAERCLADNPDPDTEYKLMINMFGTYMEMGDLAGAGSSLAKMRRIEHRDSALYTFFDRYTETLLRSQQGMHREAVHAFKELAAYAEATGIGPQYECSSYENVYKNYWALNERDSSYRYMKLCKDLSDRHGMRHKFTITLRDMADYHEYKGDAVMAMKCKADYFTELDSIFNMREFDIVKNGQATYEMDKIDSEIKELQTRHDEKEATIRQLRTVVCLAFVVIVTVSLLLVWVFREKRKVWNTYRGLFEMYHRLERNNVLAAEKEREYLAMLEEKEKENAGLRESLSQMESGRQENTGGGADMSGMDAEADVATTEKYNNSSLSEEMRNKLIRDIANVMDNTLDFCSEDFTLDRLSEKVGSNTRYVSQIINGTYGKNFNSFVNEYRIRIACARLADTSRYGMHTISAIGQSVGFRSNTTFTSVFKKITGLTPSVYQKMARERE